ncbi:MAG: U2 snRNP complex subunit [Bogoriella megaspora]|nr:MAG: U2 snRNP complex subunit [Bogoriella megaspora]
MRITADTVEKAGSYSNPLKERELSLRGLKIPAIENLGVATDYDAFDFSDNEIVSLRNFPLSHRLRTLLCARNQISVIDPSLPTSLPNVTTLVLTSNNMSKLGDLEPLAKLFRLKYLSVMGNTVANKEHYRYWVIWLCPSLRFLDYQHVQEPERKRAKELFGTWSDPSPLAKMFLSEKTDQSSLDLTQLEDKIGAAMSNRTELREPEKLRVREMLKSAKNLDEMLKIEKLLMEGRIPKGAEDVVMSG